MLPRPELNVERYRFSVCSLESRPVRALGGIAIQADGGLDELTQADTIVIPGWRSADEAPPAELVAGLRRGARLVSICTGVFVLAAAGLLDGKRVTTHWRHAERLAARFPRIIVEPLYLDEGRVLTSAGSAAGINLCLHLVRNDFGAAVANYVAKSFHRFAMAARCSTFQCRCRITRNTGSGAWSNGCRRICIEISRSTRWRNKGEHVRADLRTALPRRHRHHSAPVAHQRLIAAQRWLETTNASIEPIAEFVGTQTPATLRHHFRRKFRTSPAAYRKRFTTMAR